MLDALLIIMVVIGSAIAFVAWLAFLFFLVRSYAREDGGARIWVFEEPLSLFRLRQGPETRRAVKVALYVFIGGVTVSLLTTLIRHLI